MSGHNKEKQVMIVLIESYWEGYAQSLAWIFALGAAMSFAVWIESTAMQWVMAFFWMTTMIGWAIGENSTRKRTPEQAIAEIQAIIARRDEASRL